MLGWSIPQDEPHICLFEEKTISKKITHPYNEFHFDDFTIHFDDFTKVCDVTINRNIQMPILSS